MKDVREREQMDRLSRPQVPGSIRVDLKFMVMSLKRDQLVRFCDVSNKSIFMNTGIE